MEKAQKILLEDKQRLKANSKASAIVTNSYGHQGIETSNCQYYGKSRYKENLY